MPELEYILGREIGLRDSLGRLVVQKAPEITWKCARNLWEERMTLLRTKGISLGKAQVMALSGHHDVAETLVVTSAGDLNIGELAAIHEQSWPDRGADLRLAGIKSGIDHVVLVASVHDSDDLVRIHRTAWELKTVYQVGAVSALLNFILSARQDKNVDLQGTHTGKVINIGADTQLLAGVIDFATALEPHSSATQAFAALAGLPLAPLSPWRLAFDYMKSRGGMPPDDTVVARPDKGRNLAAMRACGAFCLPGVAFDKVRVSGQEVDVFELIPKEQELVKDKTVIVYDDEASTMGTINRLATTLDKYGAKAMVVFVVHAKLTGEWDKKVAHPLIKKVYMFDTREPIGNPRISDKMSLVSLLPLVQELIKAHKEGVNYWDDARYQEMILQLHNEETDC